MTESVRAVTMCNMADPEDEDWLALPDCPHCDNGEVWDPTAKGNTRPCSHCGGDGKVR